MSDYLKDIAINTGIIHNWKKENLKSRRYKIVNSNLLLFSLTFYESH